MKKSLRALCFMIISATIFASCGKTTPQTNENEGRQNVYTGAHTATLQKGGNTTLSLGGEEIGEQNYLTVALTTDVNLVGYLRYEGISGGQNNVEKLYIEAGATEFSTFLDAFRVGARGAFEKRLLSLELQNVENKTGNVTVTEIEVSDKSYAQNETLYIQDAQLKIGARLGAGGSLTHVEKLNADVVEYIDENGVVRIENGVDKTAVKTVTDQVNLINIYDWGREIQQSYYIEVDETHGYAPKEEVLWEWHTLLYNPVQAGSAGNKQSQIIDYTISDTEIWVKTRPLEWFFDNTLSDSYMENTYTLLDGLLLVSNRFVNFSGFTGTENLPLRAQEMPAIYVAHPLDYFYCEAIDGTIRDNQLKTTSSKIKTSATHNPSGDYHYVLDKEVLTNEWVAFVNDKDFGLGVYMPNVSKYIASRNGTSSIYEEADNCRISAVHDLPPCEYYPSAYVFNYGYLCPCDLLTIKEYEPLEYDYALYVGEIAEMRSYFNQIEKDGLITNEGLNNSK
ncbi:MAG: hypothetical protein IJX30_04350 [Clostridia bacterium]|nr:hypothetical protein [Clostridia bacterium]